MNQPIWKKNFTLKNRFSTQTQLIFSLGKQSPIWEKKLEAQKPSFHSHNHLFLIWKEGLNIMVLKSIQQLRFVWKIMKIRRCD